MTSTNVDQSKKTKSGTKYKTNEEIFLGFQKLRGEQRFLLNKSNEMELELHEHKVVLETLKDLDGDRKCYRMIGGILCERTVKDVLPILKTNAENLEKVVETLNQQIVAKGTEINKYKDEHNVKFSHVDDISLASESETKSSSGGAQPSRSGEGSAVGEGGGGGGSGVLVS